MLSDEFKKKSIGIVEELKNGKNIQEIEDSIEEAGFKKIQNPSDNINWLEFPEDITEVPSEILGQYLAVYEAYATWTNYCIVKKEIEINKANTLLSYVYGRIATQCQLRKTSDIKSYVESDEYYVECSMEMDNLNAELKLLYASLDSYERYSKAFSREITNRNNNIHGRSLSESKEIFGRGV